MPSSARHPLSGFGATADQEAGQETGKLLNTANKENFQGGKGVWKCRDCRKQFTVTMFDFRWNLRKMNDFERLVEAVAGTEGTRLYYRSPD